MERKTANRPFFSYVLTQSALVVIVLAASYLMVDLLSHHFGIFLDRIWLALGLIVATQVPVAILYARSETRDMSSGESWALATLFVAVTLGFEFGLQILTGDLDQSLALVDVLTAKAGNVGGIAFVASVCVGLFVSTLVVKLIIRKAVQCQLVQMGEVSVSNKPVQKQFSQDFSELYRRELIAANIGVFGLALVFFGSQLSQIMMVSIPLSIFFSIVCVANKMVRSTLHRTLSAQCLHISIQLMPLTVASLILLALSALYGQYTAQTGTDVSVLTYGQMIATQLVSSKGGLLQASIALGTLFALVLSANTLMLVLFARLIRPLVKKKAGTKRPIAQMPFQALEVTIMDSAEVAAVLKRGAQLVSSLQNRSSRTERPVSV